MTTENLDGLYRRKGGFKDKTQFLAVIEGKCYIVKDASGYTPNYCNECVDRGIWEKFNFPNNDSIVEGLHEIIEFILRTGTHERRF